MKKTNSGTVLFENTPDDICHLLGPGGIPNARKIGEFLEFKKRDFSVATGIPEPSIRFDDRIPAELKDRVREWAVAINLVASFFQDYNKTLLWFQIPNPILGGVKPKDMIRLGRFDRLRSYIQQSLQGYHP